MVSFKRSALALLFFAASKVFADTEPVVDADTEIPDDAVPLSGPQVTVDVQFPSSEIFGVKLINGLATKSVITFTNLEDVPVTIAAIGGSLLAEQLNPPQVVRNLTIQSYNKEIASGASESLTYAFTADLHPQDLRLSLLSIINKQDSFYTVGIYNSTVSVVEAPMSIFDPQLIFLYLVLGAAFGGTCYFIYTTWITTFFPAAKKPKTSRPKAQPQQQVDAAVDGDTATATGSKSYDASWLPAHHLQRPEAKRVGSSKGTPKTKARG